MARYKLCLPMTLAMRAALALEAERRGIMMGSDGRIPNLSRTARVLLAEALDLAESETEPGPGRGRGRSTGGQND